MNIPKSEQQRRALYIHLRKELGLTQAELAAKMEYAGQGIISMKESGERSIYARDLLALAAMLPPKE